MSACRQPSWRVRAGFPARDPSWQLGSRPCAADSASADCADRRWRCFFSVCTPAISQAVTSTSSADAVGQFYKGKQITFVVGAAVGGGYDSLARLMARHLGKHIPGNPHFVVKNISAANSLVAANDLYNVLPQDGTHIGLSDPQHAVGARAPNQAASASRSTSSIGWAVCDRRTPSRWLGKPPLQRRSKISFQRELIVGGMSGVDPETTPLVYNALIGTKFKIVNGYKGTTDIALAMERREVDGIGDWSWSSFKMSKPGLAARPKGPHPTPRSTDQKSRIAEHPLCARLRERRFRSARSSGSIFRRRKQRVPSWLLLVFRPNGWRRCVQDSCKWPWILSF